MPLIPETPIRLLKRLLWWLPATVQWVWEVNRYWMPFIMAVVICVLLRVVWPCPMEREVRVTGMVLQLLGVITIVLRLRAAQRQFPEQTLKRWWQRRPRFRTRNTVISAAGAMPSMVTGRARGRVTPGPQATLEQRLVMFRGQLYQTLG